MSINPKALEVVHPIAVSFTEKGSLGLKLTPNKATGDIEILGINPGTQAERHPQLATGLVLKTVGGASVAGKKYEEVLGMIKAGGRPLAMVFVDKVDGVTGAAAAKALQEHIMKKGTGDVKKIDRLRRASLQPDLPGSAQKAQDEAAAMMAAAMSSVDEEAGDAPASAPGTPNQTASLSQRIEDLEAAKDAAAKARNFREAGRIKEQLQPLRRTMVEALYAKHNPEKLPQVDGLVAKYGEEKLYKMVRKKYSELHAQPAAAAGGDGTPAAVAAAGAVTTVIFTEPGALGLKFTPNKLTGGVEVLQVNPGTQAERHTQLHPGLVLQTIGEVSAAGKPYDQVIATIKAGGRPLSMTFSSDTSAPAAALDSIAVSFTEKGSLGLKLTPNKATGDIEILGINPGTQAERHPQLATGLVLKTVGGASVAGKKYEEVLGMIKAGGRPLAMVFVGKANEAPLGEPKVESSNDEAAVAPEQVEEGVPPMEASAVFRGAISGESNIELEPEKAPEPEKEPEPEQEPEQEPESEPVQQPQGPSQAAIEAIPRREPRPKFFNAGGATRNPYRAPLEEMKQKQLQQLQKFQQYAAAGDWQDIHAGHFDWFMFPIEDGSQHSYNVLAEDVVELLADDEWRERYYSSVQLVAAAWAWDIASSQPISPPLAGQGWTDWDVRLSKMIRSLWLFGCRAEMRSLQAFALTVKPHGGLRCEYHTAPS
jgi:succinyl-CoA synthetase alpha subunit